VKSRVREAQQRNEQAIEANVERLMADNSFAKLRTRGARVALVVVATLLIVVMVPAWTLAGSIVGIFAAVAAAGTWWLLKLSVRDVADLPDRFLDERQLAVRNQVYVEAYRWFAGGTVILASVGIVAFIVRGEDPDIWTVDLTYEWCMGLFWTVMAGALLLPSMVLAIRDREDVLSTSA
jgi:hypothetical protein